MFLCVFTISMMSEYSLGKGISDNISAVLPACSFIFVLSAGLRVPFNVFMLILFEEGWLL